MEQIHTFMLVKKSTWLLSEDEKWSTKVLKKKGEDFHFDTLYLYFSFKVSIKERSLNSLHRKKCEESSQSKIMLTPDGLSTTQRLKHYIEECMPLAQTPRLDLYFDNSELTTFALLNTACVEFLCKNTEEYCLLRLSPHHHSQLLTS